MRLQIGLGVAREYGIGFLFVTSFTSITGLSESASGKQWTYVTRKQRHRRLSRLFTIDAHIPKLDVAGSSPVSRSIISRTYGDHGLLRLLR
jgi:hypothetical protein